MKSKIFFCCVFIFSLTRLSAQQRGGAFIISCREYHVFSQGNWRNEHLDIFTGSNPDNQNLYARFYSFSRYKWNDSISQWYYSVHDTVDNSGASYNINHDTIINSLPQKASKIIADDNWLPTQQTKLVWNGASWDTIEKINSVLIFGNKILDEITTKKINGQWINKTKWNYAYDSTSQKLKTLLIEQWDTSFQQWRNYLLDTASYPIGNYNFLVSRSRWDTLSFSWKPLSRKYLDIVNNFIWDTLCFKKLIQNYDTVFHQWENTDSISYNIQFTTGGANYIASKHFKYLTNSWVPFQGDTSCWIWYGGISEISNSDFNIFPNPTTNNLTIESLNSVLLDKIIISDVTGRIITQLKPTQSSTQLDIKSFNPGIYFVQMKSNKRIEVKKFVKQ